MLQENRQRVILEEKRRKREEARKAAAEKKAAAKGQAGVSVVPPEEEEGCVIDNLLKEIRSGTTLRPTQRKSTHRAPQLSAKELERLKKIAAQVVDGSSTLQDAVGEESKGGADRREGEGEGERRDKEEAKSNGIEEKVVTKPAASSFEGGPLINGAGESSVDKPHPPTESPKSSDPDVPVVMETAVDKPHPPTESAKSSDPDVPVGTETAVNKPHPPTESPKSSDPAVPVGTVDKPHPPIESHLEKSPTDISNQSGGVVSIEAKVAELGMSEGEGDKVAPDETVQRERGGGQAEKVKADEISVRSLSPIERRLHGCSPDQEKVDQVMIDRGPDPRGHV